MNTQDIASHLNLAQELILEVQEWASVLWVRIKGMRPRFVSKKMNQAALKITVCDMRAAGKPGYVARIEGSEKHFLQNRKAESFTTSTKKVNYEITKDGIYEVCDANFGGRKRNIKFIKIENGQIVQEAEKLTTLQIQDVELPNLTGSVKQIAWAEAIREKMLARLSVMKKEIPDWVFLRTEAKFWIDNRDKL